jgi:hypothetical protein
MLPRARVRHRPTWAASSVVAAVRQHLDDLGWVPIVVFFEIDEHIGNGDGTQARDVDLNPIAYGINIVAHSSRPRNGSASPGDTPSIAAAATVLNSDLHNLVINRRRPPPLPV